MIQHYAFLFLWLFGVLLILISGKQPNPYLVHVRKIPLPHAYPWEEVLTYCLLITVEILVLYWILRPKTYNLSWLRSLSGSLFFFILGGAHLFTLMHAPSYMLFHCMYLFCIGIMIFVFSMWALVNKNRFGSNSKESINP
ncbi:hypothetical protein [Leptospira interrogans]|uniref:hypothetical protein n=1 Tax=Leptospira interrogans TaxID=173 RepID=UPI000774003F|nr:hypothetical protein [Leptospira interrogans]